MTFSLTYNKQGTKELTVKILEFKDLPLSRETGYTIPFVNVYLSPRQQQQQVHQNEDMKISSNDSSNQCCVETMCFPREFRCSFVGYSYEKLMAYVLKVRRICMIGATP